MTQAAKPTTAIDRIDWDKMASDLVEIFNREKLRNTSSYEDKIAQSTAGIAAAAAAQALAALSAEARAQREAASKDGFKIEKGTQP